MQGDLSLSSCALVDAAGADSVVAVLSGVQLRSGRRVAGPAFTVRFDPTDDPAAPFSDYLELVPEGCVIVLDNAARQGLSVWGGLLTHEAVRRRVAGTLVYGAVRDIDDAVRLSYPVCSTAITPASGRGRVRVVATEQPVDIGGVLIEPGDWICGDADGVVAVPAARAPELLERAARIEARDQQIAAYVLAGVPLSLARHAANETTTQTNVKPS